MQQNTTAASPKAPSSSPGSFRGRAKRKVFRQRNQKAATPADLLRQAVTTKEEKKERQDDSTQIASQSQSQTECSTILNGAAELQAAGIEKSKGNAEDPRINAENPRISAEDTKINSEETKHNTEGTKNNAESTKNDGENTKNSEVALTICIQSASSPSSIENLQRYEKPSYNDFDQSSSRRRFHHRQRYDDYYPRNPAYYQNSGTSWRATNTNTDTTSSNRYSNTPGPSFYSGMQYYPAQYSSGRRGGRVHYRQRGRVRRGNNGWGRYSNNNQQMEAAYTTAPSDYMDGSGLPNGHPGDYANDAFPPLEYNRSFKSPPVLPQAPTIPVPNSPKTAIDSNNPAIIPNHHSTVSDTETVLTRFKDKCSIRHYSHRVHNEDVNGSNGDVHANNGGARVQKINIQNEDMHTYNQDMHALYQPQSAQQAKQRNRSTIATESVRYQGWPPNNYYTTWIPVIPQDSAILYRQQYFHPYWDSSGNSQALPFLPDPQYQQYQQTTGGVPIHLAALFASVPLSELQHSVFNQIYLD